MSRSNGHIPVSVIVFTLNEELNLPFCLDSLGRFDEVFVVDSYSSDRTESICRERGVDFVQNTFAGFGTQRNWALENLDLRNDWVLILDADERMSLELEQEIDDRIRKVSHGTGAFRVKRRFQLWGRWLRYSSLYPTWVVRLVHKDKVRYIDRGHAETQSVEGDILDLANDLIDENRKGIDEWFARQNSYSSRDAEYELAEQRKPLNVSQIISTDPTVRRAALKRLAYRVPARGLAYFLYSYVWKRGFLDGRDGLVFCRMRAMYQTMVAIKKHDLRKRGPPTGTDMRDG